MPSRFSRVALIAGAAFIFSSAMAEPGVEDARIVISGSNAMSGSVAAVCAPATYGAMAWFNKVNAAGGVHGRKIEYNILDDAYLPQRAIANARRMVQQDNVFAIFGGCATATQSAILSFLGGYPDVPYLFPWAAMPELTEPVKKSVYALMPSWSAQINGMLPYTIQNANPKPKTAAILMINVPGAEAMRKAARAIFAAQGIKVVYDELFEVNVPDHTPYILQMKAQNPDLAVLGDSAAGAAKMFLTMKRQNWHPRVGLGVATLSAEQFLDPVNTYADDWLTTVGIVAPPTAPSATECSAAVKQSYPELKPSHFTMFGCLAAQVFVEGLNRAGRNLTRAGLVSALNNMQEFDPKISGPVSFTATDHTGAHTVVPIGVKDGKFVVLGPALKAKE
ncbi:ABC transporter substrate-binding protein [Paucibacter sp. R3-3]|uniref:ABC transporter substrate-binding protein n=1 Tax=Roseateles agri TaxID=3098619 RepID=A0ABU5DSJ7_9BURK|nr:ABC transporter substrate-binding protein [Paucibacter sp. R3-3]MDY0748047.1 ABC transporter substrate-binding protein [Paucibacter sp. R3-3]